eukprot:7978981-Lingulodinium_polyedra.AAC.1
MHPLLGDCGDLPRRTKGQADRARQLPGTAGVWPQGALGSMMLMMMIQYKTIQYNTIQYNTMQNNTTQ